MAQGVDNPAKDDRSIIQVIGEKFGYPAGSRNGLQLPTPVAANRLALDLARESRPLRGRVPVLYASTEAPLDVPDSSGFEVRRIPVEPDLRMDITALAIRVRADKESGLVPCLVIAEAYSPDAGVIDPLEAIAEVAEREKLWFHLDAASGGTGVLCPELEPLFLATQRADSIAVDLSEWVSGEEGGLLLTRHPGRRSSKIDFDMLLERARAKIRAAKKLRERLSAARWTVVNPSRLNVVCFVDSLHPEGRTREYVERLARKTGLSTARFSHDGTPALRVETDTTTDPDALVSKLNAARENEIASGLRPSQ